MSIGAVFDEAWGLYTRFFARFFVIALSVFLFVNLVTGFLGLILENEGPGLALYAVVSAALSLVGFFAVTGVLVETTRDVRDGVLDLAVGDVFRKVQPLLPTLVVAGLLATIGVAVGLVLLIVPGLVLLTRWALLAPVIVLEGGSVGDAFSRSNALVRGNSWTVFGLIVIIAIVGSVVSWIVSGLLGTLLGFLGFWLGGMIGNAAVAPFFAVVATIVYLRLAEISPPAAGPPEPQT